jgi:lariat debranching enzyme
MSEPKYFAAVGDVHKQMNIMVGGVRQWEDRFLRRIDFVLQVGDFEPHRNKDDLTTMHAPKKYKKGPGDFPEYHAGQRRFPRPVYFIGGNHEPYGFLAPLPERSKIAANCYYLGQVGELFRGGIHILGISGKYGADEHHRRRPDAAKIHMMANRRFGFFRQSDIDRASAAGPVDVLMLHDWPSGIEPGKGNDPASHVVHALRPQLVLCGHVHRAFRGEIQANSGTPTRVCCLDKIRPWQRPLESDSHDWMAVFRIGADRRITEVTGSG